MDYNKNTEYYVSDIETSEETNAYQTMSALEQVTIKTEPVFEEDNMAGIFQSNRTCLSDKNYLNGIMYKHFAGAGDDKCSENNNGKVVSNLNYNMGSCDGDLLKVKQENNFGEEQACLDNDTNGHSEILGNVTCKIENMESDDSQNMSDKIVGTIVLQNVEAVLTNETDASGPKKVHTCDKCDKTFKSPYDLRRHQQTHLQSKDHHCKLCDKSFKGKKWLENHIQSVHIQETSLECDICNSTFKSARGLQNHMVRHGIKDKISKPWNKCSFCSKIFKNNSDLKRHEEVHGGKLEHICELCGKVSKTKKVHENHMLAKHTSCSLLKIKRAGKKLKSHERNRHEKNNSHDYNYESVNSLQSETELSLERSIQDDDTSNVDDVIKTIDSLMEMADGQDKPAENLNDDIECNSSLKKLDDYIVCEVNTNSEMMETEDESNISDVEMYGELENRAGSRKDKVILATKCEKRKKHLCDVCGKEFKALCDVNRHMEIHMKNKRVMCNICGRYFKGSKWLENHKLLFHSDDYPHSCPVCNKGFKRLGEMNKHLLVHTEGYVEKTKQRYSCSICPKKFRSPSEALRHEVLHGGQLEQKCDLCGQCFRTKNWLENHMSRKHTAKRRICEWPGCDKAFRTRHELEKHKLIHTGELIRTCKVCDKQLASPGALRTHMLLHVTKQFHCDICSKSFARPHGLQLHKNTVHEGKKPYLCTICGKNFSNVSNLKKHANIAHTLHKDEIKK